MRRALTLAVVGVTTLGVLVALPSAADAHPKPRRVAPAPVIEEDDPRWDCRIHGNRTCGTRIADQWYLVTFRNGQPVSVEVAR